MYQREYRKIYETYVASRNKKLIKEDMTVARGAVASEIPEDPDKLSISGDATAPVSSPIDQLKQDAPEHQQGLDGITATSAPDEKSQYLQLVQHITSFLMKADNLTQSEIDSVLATLNKAKFAA